MIADDNAQALSHMGAGRSPHERLEKEMMTQLETVKRRLFDNDGLRASNIKMFPGSDRDATPEKMAEQINKVIAQISDGDFEEMDLSDD